MMYFDIHSHLNDARFDTDIDEVLLRMRASGVATIVVGTDRSMSERALTLAEKHPDIWATIGCHPTDNHLEVFDDVAYQEMAMHPRVVAIGECGLDYYWPSTEGWKNGEQREKSRQRELFERQIAIAKKSGKPLMIHGRPTKGGMDAYEDILEILRSHQSVRGNIHFFVGNIEIAKQFLDIGFTMSFTGVLTFSHDYDEVVRYLPLASIMSETDAPYVAPTAHRGKRNEPAFVIETVSKIAQIRTQDEQEVARALLENALKTFTISHALQ
jgi:TatD DNase family protein